MDHWPDLPAQRWIHLRAVSTHKPLAGVYVLDLSRFAPGGFCSLLLADLGADVVKVEAPNTGDGLRGMYGSGFDAAHIALNRGKRSIALDLRHHDAPRVLEKLVAAVRDRDRFAPSWPTRPLRARLRGAMAEANPPVVWCSITGFGDFGPNAQHPGHDLTYLGYGGLLSKLSDRDPTPPGTVVSIPLAATMASTGILAALHAAERTGQGTHLDVSMTDSAMWVRSEDIARAANAPGPTWGTSANAQRLPMCRRAARHRHCDRAEVVGEPLRCPRRSDPRRSTGRRQRRLAAPGTPRDTVLHEDIGGVAGHPWPRRRSRTGQRRR